MIKLHALLEAGVTDQLTRAIERKELSDIFSRLEMSNNKTGKLAFVRALNLLPTAHIQFIRGLSELRNELVHKVQNVNVNLVEYFRTKTSNFTPQDLRKFGDRWAFGVKVVGDEKAWEPLARFSLTIKPKEKLPDGIILDRVRFLLATPKVAIWFTALAILDAISLCNRYGPQIWPFVMECEYRKELEDLVNDVFDRAKVGDPELPEKLARKYEHLNPGVRVRRDHDGQPDLLSLAAAMRVERLRLLDQL